MKYLSARKHFFSSAVLTFGALLLHEYTSYMSSGNQVGISSEKRISFIRSNGDRKRLFFSNLTPFHLGMLDLRLEIQHPTSSWKRQFRDNHRNQAT